MELESACLMSVTDGEGIDIVSSQRHVTLVESVMPTTQRLLKSRHRTGADFLHKDNS